MKGNYLKSYFKSFGVVSFLVVLAAVLGLGVLAFGPSDIILKSVDSLNLIKGLLLMLAIGFTVVGMTALKSDKVGFADLFRLVGFISYTVIAVFILVFKSSGNKYLIAFAGLALLLLVQVIIRFIYCHEASDTSIKGYFSALARKYNPIVIVLLSAIVSIGLFFLIKDNLLDKVVGHEFNIASYKMLLVGAIVAGLACVFIPAFDSKQEVTLVDLGCAVGLLSCLFTLFTVLNYVKLNEANYFLIAVLAVVFVVALVGRGITYSKKPSEIECKCKAKSYFKGAYLKYDSVFQYLAAAVIIALIALPFVLYNQTNWLTTYIFKVGGPLEMTKDLSFFVGLAAMILCLVLFLLILCGKNKNSAKIEFVDAPLIPGIAILGFLIPFAVMLLMNERNELAILKDNIILIGSLGFGLLVGLEALIVTFIRIKHYNPELAAEDADELAEELASPVEEEAPAEEENPEETLENPEEAWEEAMVLEELQEEAPEEPAEESEDIEEPVIEEIVSDEEEPAEEPAEEPVEEAPMEEAAAEEPAIEAPMEEAAAEEPVEENLAEEAEEDEEAEEEEADDEEEDEEPTELLKAEPKKPTLVIQDVNQIDSEGKPKKIKRKFNTKMMYAPYETKEYYSEVKNYLMMYKAKGRGSSRCETFRHKGLVARVALGGKAIKVYLAMDTAIVESEPRYHLKDCTDKKQYSDTPVMIKVKSARSLKYFKELVDMMMAEREIKPKKNFKPVDYTLELIPNGEAILATLGMSTDYMQETMNAHGIPQEMPDDLIDYIPVMADEAIDDEIVETSIYLDTLCSHFEDGDVITLDTLKELHIINRGNVLRIKARGTLDRKLTIYADKFDDDALKMMMCTNCTAVRIVRE